MEPKYYRTACNLLTTRCTYVYGNCLNKTRFIITVANWIMLHEQITSNGSNIINDLLDHFPFSNLRNMKIIGWWSIIVLSSLEQTIIYYIQWLNDANSFKFFITQYDHFRFYPSNRSAIIDWTHDFPTIYGFSNRNSHIKFSFIHGSSESPTIL